MVQRVFIPKFFLPSFHHLLFSMDHDDQRPFGDGSWNRRNPFNSLWSMTNLSPKIQRHLVSVYSNLSLTTLLASIACYLSIHNYLPNLSILPLILGIVLLVFVLFSRPSPNTNALRTASLYGFGFAEGWGIAPFIQYYLSVDSNTVFLALLATFIAFISFTASAVTSPRRSQLYLGGFLGALLSVTTLLSLSQLFYPTAFLHSTELYLGLFIFCGYILYDTQVIIERADMYTLTEPDAVVPAAMLFTDAVNVLVRLVEILARQQQQQGNNRGRRKGDERKRRGG